jgi:hypothetical protein
MVSELSVNSEHHLTCAGHCSLDLLQLSPSSTPVVAAAPAATDSSTPQQQQQQQQSVVQGTAAAASGWVVRYCGCLWRSMSACCGDIEAGQLLGYHFAEASQVWLFELRAWFYVLGIE